MKKLIYTLFCSLSISFNLSGQNGSWDWVNPYPTGEQINQAFFFNPTEGFILGNGGMLMHTTDGGDTWQQADIARDVFLFRMIFPDATTGWVVGISSQTYGLKVFKTTDGGLTWVEQILPGSHYASTGDITFTDTQNGWIVGENGQIFQTADGGSTWIDKSIVSGIIPTFYFVNFTSLTEGLALGRAYFTNQVFVVARTTNGGNTWVLKFTGLQNEMRAAKQFNNASITTVGTTGLILQSRDSAASWSFSMGQLLHDLNAVAFYDDAQGIAVGEGGSIVKTTDGGSSWQEILSGFSSPLRSVQFISDSHVIAGGGQSLSYPATAPNILISNDGGNSWNNKTRFIDPAINITGINFTSQTHGWIAGAGYIFGTTDGGINWNLLRVNPNDDLRDIAFVDSLNGFAVGNRFGQALILRTTNGGSTWQAQTFSVSSYLFRAAYPSPNIGYAVGENGSVLRTTNGGQSWSVSNSGTNNSLLDVKFISADQGWIANGASVLKTTDGGTTWTANTVNSSDYIKGVSFPTANIGYAASYNYVYASSNGGATWQQLPETFSGIRDLLFTDANNGWLLDWNGVLTTTDGGQNWQYDLFEPFGVLNLERFTLSPDETLWGAGPNANIRKYSGEIVSSVPIRHSAAVPQKFSLQQNFPNPFNPTTAISYNLPQRTKVVLTIHNVLGQEVAQLVDDWQEAGSYQVNWNGEGLASGTYFYRLHAGSAIESKKMVLAK